MGDPFVVTLAPSLLYSSSLYGRSLIWFLRLANARVFNAERQLKACCVSFSARESDVVEKSLFIVVASFLPLEPVQSLLSRRARKAS